MNYQEYIEKREELTKALNDLRLKYIEEHGYLEGSAVRFKALPVNPRWTAKYFVVSTYIEGDGKVCMNLRKAKKDGSPSKTNPSEYWVSADKIEPWVD